MTEFLSLFFFRNTIRTIEPKKTKKKKEQQASRLIILFLKKEAGNSAIMHLRHEANYRTFYLLSI